MAFQWHDHYTRIIAKESERIVLTENEIGIEGLCCFGYNKSHIAQKSLDDHYHKNCIELAYVAGGAMAFEVQNRFYKLYGGDIFVTRENIPHSTGRTPHGISELYWLQLSIEDSPDYLLLSPKGKELFFENLFQLRNGAFKIGMPMGQILKKAFFMMDSENIARKYSAVSLIVHLIFSILECQNNEYYNNLTEDIVRAVDYITENIKDEIDLEELSKSCYLSLSRFKGKFKEQIGMTPRDFINSQKIVEAKSMLLNGMSVNDVALKLNFTSSAYFSKVFKKYTTLSPSGYIKTNEETFE